MPLTLSRVTRLSGCLLLLTALQASAQLNLELPDMNLPDMGSSASSALSTTEEAQLGKVLYRQVRRQHSVIEDVELTDWIRALGNRLALSSPNRNGQLYFVLDNNPEVNAYTLAGGVIIINSGLILNTQSESELAAVMAHEIAHVSQRHIARMLAENKTSPLLTGLGILAGAAIASQSPNAGQAIMTGAMALQAHNQIVFSQRAESEADRVGLRILAGAGFDTSAMAHFLEKLDRSESSVYGDISKYLNTHPLTLERVSDVRSRAGKNLPGHQRENVAYQFARARLQQLTGQSSLPLKTVPAPQLDNYVQALRQARAGNHQAVLRVLGERSNQLPLALLIADALTGMGRLAEAEQLLRAQLNAYPGQESLIQALADTLVRNKKNEQAMQLLSKIILSENTSLEFIETAQRIAAQSGHPAEASLYSAERSIRIGEYAHARATLEQARTLPGATPQGLATIQNRLREVEKMQAMQAQ